MVALDYFWNNLLLHWLHTIFTAPFLNPDMLWIIVPVWISWFFSEFFQEKSGTSMGNAISNSLIVIWASIDCARQTIKLISAGEVGGSFDIFLRFFIISLLFLYGAMVLALGMRGNQIIRKIGRIREMTYVFIIFVPIVYNHFPLTFNHIFSAIIFFPLFYYSIELLDRITPDPVAVRMDNEDLAVAASKKSDLKQSEQQQMSQQMQAQPSRQPANTQRQAPVSPLLSNRGRGGSFWDFKI